MIYGRLSCKKESIDSNKNKQKLPFLTVNYAHFWNYLFIIILLYYTVLYSVLLYCYYTILLLYCWFTNEWSFVGGSGGRVLGNTPCPFPTWINNYVCYYFCIPTLCLCVINIIHVHVFIIMFPLEVCTAYFMPISGSLTNCRIMLANEATEMRHNVYL